MILGATDNAPRASESGGRRSRLATAVVLSGVLATATLFIIEMSGSARRIASTDHVNPVAFVAIATHDARDVCQRELRLPADRGLVKVLVGSYGQAVPEVTMTYRANAGDGVLARGRISGTHEGLISIPYEGTNVARVESGELCLRFAGDKQIALGGDISSPDVAARVGDANAAGRLSITVLKPRAESWWQMLPTLDARLGYGKAGLGSWTLPIVAGLLALCWIVVVRLLIRELQA